MVSMGGNGQGRVNRLVEGLVDWTNFHKLWGLAIYLATGRLGMMRADAWWLRSGWFASERLAHRQASCLLSLGIIWLWQASPSRASKAPNVKASASRK